MALSQSALSELLEAFRTGDGVDMIRESIRTVLQELVELEAAGVIGAGRSEHTDDRFTERNGTRAKVLATKAGDVDLRIPKLRKGPFFPSILEPRRRIDQALYAVMEAYVHGISTRSVDDLVVALGADSGISKSEVSRICEQRDESVGTFRTRPLDHIAFPYVGHSAASRPPCNYDRTLGGHAKSTTTLTTYAHLWPTAEDRVRDGAARLAAEVLSAGEGAVRAGDA